MRIGEAIDRFTALFRSSPPGPRQSDSASFMGRGLLNRLGYQSPNTTGVAVTERSALSLPAFYAGVNCIASDLSAIPLELLQVMPDGSTRKAKEHKAWPIFSRSPDGNTTSIRFRSALTAHAIIYGGGYAEIVPAIDSSRVYLFLLDPEATSITLSPGGEVSYQTSGGTLPKEKVVHFSGLSHDSLCGHPLVRLARQALGLGLAGQDFAASFLGNGTGAAGWFVPPNELRAEAKKEFLDSVEERHKGPEMAGRLGILPVGWTFEESKGGSNPEQAQLLDMRAFTVLDVARLLRVPPHKLGDKSGESYASIEASNLEYIQGTLLPWAEALEQSLNLRLLTDEEAAAGYTWRHDFKSLLRADATGRANLIKTMFTSKALTPNEIRISEGYQPIDQPDMNATYMQLNQGTGEQAQKDQAGGK
jgi:HK97 family phage portal protein